MSAQLIVLACSLPREHRAVRSLAGDDVHIAVSGVGPDRATRLGERVSEMGPAAIIAVGFCGALHPDVALGEAIAAETVVDARDGARFDADPALLAASAARRGVLVSTPALVRTPAERAAIEGTVVDMESAAIARAAAAAGIPFLALRATTDTAGDSLPDMGDLLSPGGRPRLGRLAWIALTKPGALAELRRLQDGAERAEAELAGAVGTLLGRLRG